MNEIHANQEAGPQSYPQDGDQGHVNHGWRTIRNLVVAVMTVLAAYVEILLFASYAQEHWNDLWFKCLTPTFPITLGLAVYGVFRSVARWGRSTSAYAGFVVSMVVAAALLSAYTGDSMVKSHPKTVAYSIASILTALLVAPIWYGAYRFSRGRPTPVAVPETQPTSQPSNAPSSPNADTSPVRPFAKTQVENRLGDLRESILRLHGITASDSAKEDQLRRLQSQVMELYFPAVAEGIIPPLNPPLTRSHDRAEILHDWRRLAERIDTPLAPHPQMVAAGKVGDVYVNSPIGITGWIDHAAALVRVLKDQASGAVVNAPRPVAPESQPPASSASAVTKNGPRTVKEHFDSDFTTGDVSNSMKLWMNDGKTYLLPYRVVTDFIARSKFLAFYVPDAPNAMYLCKALAENLQAPLDAVNQSLSMILTDGVAQTSLADLTFSGRVFIYHENLFSLQELATIESYFQSKGAAVEFRGIRYVASRWIGKPSPPPATRGFVA
jgi:hypothetical protein